MSDEPRIRLDDDPLWYKDAIIYEAHVRAFYDSNDDGIGDFRGLTQKLDYLEDLVAAYRILAEYGVIDAYGHVSMRSPENRERYFIARSLAPEVVQVEDIMEYDLDSNPLNAGGRASFLERYIHGAIYKARPDVKAVVHSHSPAVIPFGADQRQASAEIASSRNARLAMTLPIWPR